MIYYLVLSVLLTVPYNCVGHSYNPIFSGILSGAQNVGSDVQAALHGLAQGIDLNFQGSLNSNRGQHQYGYQKPNNYYPSANNKPTPPTETIIVIVEEEPEPQQNNYGQRPQRPQPNYGHGRPHHNHNFNKPNFQDKPGYNYGYNSNNNGQNYYNNNNYNQNRPHQHNGPPGYGNTPNGPYDNNNYNQNQNDAPNHYGDTQPSEQPDQYKPPKQITTEAPKEISTEAPKAKPHYWNDKELTTTTPKDDKPYFVPLNQNEYIYGGDKIEINAPKRETNENNKPASEDDDDESFPIDVRIKQR